MTTIEQETLTPFLPIIDDGSCGDARCFQKLSRVGNTSDNFRLGHISKITFPKVEIELEQDTLVINPENPDLQEKIAATIRCINWTGEYIALDGVVTPQNRALLMEALTLSNKLEKVEIEISFIVYEYDFAANQYFKRLRTLNNPIKCYLTREHRAYVDENTNSYMKEEILTFSFGFCLYPQEKLNQEIGYAFRSDGIQFTL